MAGKPSTEAMSLSVGVVALSLSAFGALLPTVTEVRGQVPTEDRVQLVRGCLMNAAVVALLAGTGASIAAKSAVPIIAATAAVGWLVWQYDSAARQRPV